MARGRAQGRRRAPRVGRLGLTSVPRAPNNYRLFTEQHADAVRSGSARLAPRDDPDRSPVTGYRFSGPGEQRAARLVAVLRTGGFAFPIIEAVIEAMRASGGMDSALAALSRRDEQVYRLSARRLRATAVFHGYLAKYYPSP